MANKLGSVAVASPMSDQFDRVAPQPHLTVRLEHEQLHDDLLARYLGADSGMTDEGTGDDAQPVADPGVFPSALDVWQVDGAVALAGAQGVDRRRQSITIGAAS